MSAHRDENARRSRARLRWTVSPGYLSLVGASAPHQYQLLVNPSLGSERVEVVLDTHNPSQRGRLLRLRTATVRLAIAFCGLHCQPQLGYDICTHIALEFVPDFDVLELLGRRMDRKKLCQMCGERGIEYEETTKSSQLRARLKSFQLWRDSKGVVCSVVRRTRVWRGGPVPPNVTGAEWSEWCELNDWDSDEPLSY